MSTLYRDYRPQKFAEVLGQKHIKIALQNEIAAGKLAQAFLFCGPRAVGKTTLARVLAKAVNCTNRQSGESEPCGQCDSCRSIVAGNNLDIIEIDAASNTGVDNVRDNIISFSRLAPSAAKYKVFIIDEVHMLSASAFNALLKIIEEPPTYVIFILCTTEIHKVPLTIVSRCERFDFKRISVSDIVQKLSTIALKEEFEVDPEVLEAVARKSGGHLRDAESLLGQIFSLGDKRISLEQAELVIPHYNSHEAVDFIEYLTRKDAAKALSLINSLVDSGVNIRNFNAELVNLLRKMIISKVSPELSDSFGLNLGDSLEMKINSLSAGTPLDKLVAYVRRLITAYDEKNPLILQLPLELAAVEICAAPGIAAAPPRVAPAAAPTKTRPAAVVPPAPNKTEAPSAPAADRDFSLSAEAVKEKWPEFLVKIKKYNHSLSFVLQNCEPQEISAGQVRLVFKYKFHQDRVLDPTIRAIIDNVLAEVFSRPVTFSVQLDENLDIKRESESASSSESESIAPAPSSAPGAEKNNGSGALMDNLLKAFGGEIIN